MDRGCIAVTDEEIGNYGGLRWTARQIENRPKALRAPRSRFFDIRWPQNDQAFFRFATGREINVFNVHLGIGQGAPRFGPNTGLIRGFDREHIGLKARERQLRPGA